MVERGPICQEIDSIVCPTCPVRDLTEGKWQVDGRQVTPLDTAEALQDVVHEAVHPEEHGALEDDDPISRGLQGVHDNVVALFTEGMRSDGGFWRGDQPGEVILRSSGVVSPGDEWKVPPTAEIIPEENFSSSATAFLTCIRRNQAEACIEGVRDVVPGIPSPDSSPLGQIADVKLGVDVLNALVEEGSPDAMRAKLKDIVREGTHQRDFLRALATPEEIDRMSKAELSKELLKVARYLKAEHERNQDNG